MKTTGQLDLSGWFPSVDSRWPPITVPEPPEVGKGGDLKNGWWPLHGSQAEEIRPLTLPLPLCCLMVHLRCQLDLFRVT